MNKTLIPWVKNPDGTPGYTWNPITGCLNGCSYCYARKLANTRLKDRYLANKNIAGSNPHENVPYVPVKLRVMEEENPFYPRFWPEKLEELHNRNRGISRGLCPEPKGIFVCNMSDLFGIGIPKQWTEDVLDAIEMNERHDRFYLLTKQPQNLVQFSPFPDNAWVGVSATDFESYGKALMYLSEIQAKIKYLSFEPLLNSLTHNNEKGFYNIDCMTIDFKNYINWLIIGSQTKPTVHPDPKWVQEIVIAANQSNIPVFVKEPLYFYVQEPKTAWMKLQRQEMPK